MEWSDAVNAVQEGYIHELSGALAAGLGKATSEDGVTLLHWAAYNNRIAIARLLIESGADVNIKGGTLEETPLMWAMRRKFYAMGALLVESGAKFDIESKTGYDVVHNAVRLQSDTLGGDVEGLFLLLEWGANPDHVDKNGDTPISWVARNKFGSRARDMILLLLRYHDMYKGAKPYYELQMEKFNGNSLLHDLAQKTPTQGESISYADLNAALAVHQHPEVSSWKGKTRASVENSDGLSAYQVAQMSRNTYMGLFLLDALLYNQAPRVLPGLVSSSVVLGFAFLLGHFGYLVAIVVGGLYGTLVNRFFLQWGIPCQHVKVYGGLFWAMELLMLYHHQVVLAPHISTFSHLVFWVALIALVLLSVRLARTNPVTLPEGERGALAKAFVAASPQEGPREGSAESKGDKEDFIDGVLTRPVLEATSMCDLRYALHHCEFTGKNVCGFDIHVPHLGVCVGQGNRRMFIVVLFVTALAALLHFLTALSVHSTDICPDAGGWFVFHYFAVEACTANAQPVAFYSLMVAFFVLAYALLVLNSEFTFVVRHITLHMAATRVVNRLPSYSNDQMSANFKKFFRDGTFSVSLDDVVVEYPPPKRARELSYTRGDVEMPSYVQSVASAAGAHSEKVRNAYRAVVRFWRELSGANQKDPLYGIDTMNSESDLCMDEEQPLHEDNKTFRLFAAIQWKTDIARKNANSRRRHNHSTATHDHGSGHSHGERSCCHHDSGPARSPHAAVVGAEMDER